MRMSKANIREAQLLNELRLRGSVSVAEAVALLGISEATVRRLFAQLEREGKAIRSYGGIQIPVSLDNYSFERYAKVHTLEKCRIGIAASALVESGDSLYLDCGTTVIKMAEALSQRIESGEVRSLNIVTNSIANLNALGDAPDCRVILLGGEYNHERRDFSGSITEKCLNLFHFRKCFLGCEGWSLDSGFSSNHLGLSSLNGKVIERSDRRYVLADNSKFGKDGLISYTDTPSVNTVVTDSRPGEEIWEALKTTGMEIIVAPTD